MTTCNEKEIACSWRTHRFITNLAATHSFLPFLMHCFGLSAHVQYCDKYLIQELLETYLLNMLKGEYNSQNNLMRQ